MQCLLCFSTVNSCFSLTLLYSLWLTKASPHSGGVGGQEVSSTTCFTFKMRKIFPIQPSIPIAVSFNLKLEHLESQSHDRTLITCFFRCVIQGSRQTAPWTVWDPSWTSPLPRGIWLPCLFLPTLHLLNSPTYDKWQNSAKSTKYLVLSSRENPILSPALRYIRKGNKANKTPMKLCLSPSQTVYGTGM